jgi:hypothetical protein
MRIRIAVASVLLLLPAALSAQRIPLPGIGRGPTRPQPLPPQPGPIAQELAYKRLPISVESYPFVSFINAPGIASNGLISSWTSIGAGARLDYRFNRFVSGTLDLTSSYWGGPAVVQTAELGTRFHRERTESKWYPYADLRLGYVSAYNRNLGAFDNVFVDPATQGGYGVQYSHGFAGIAGLGTEYAISRMFSLTTGFSVMNGRMSTHDLRSGQYADRAFPMTSVRYTIGLNFNPVRTVRAMKNNVH